MQTTHVSDEWQEETLLHKVRRVLAEEGVPRCFIELVKKILSPVVEFGSVRIMEYQLDRTVDAGELPPGFRLFVGKSSDLNRMLEAYENLRTASELQERFSNGDLSFLITDPQGRGIHCRWAKTERFGYIPDLDMSLLLDPEEGYMFDAHTRANFRHRGIDAPARAFVMRTLARAGLKRAYGYVRSGRRSSLRAALRLGKPVGRVWYLRLRGCKPISVGARRLIRPTLAPGIPVFCAELQKAR